MNLIDRDDHGRGVSSPTRRPPSGRRLLTPGMFVRIQLPVGQPHPALLIIDRAVGSDQGVKYVYVVDAENKVQYRKVTLGALQEDGLRVIDEGLKPGRPGRHRRPPAGPSRV